MSDEVAADLQRDLTLQQVHALGVAQAVRAIKRHIAVDTQGLDKLGADVQVAKRSELHTFAVIPQRWVVERSFAWLEKCRRLWKNCVRKLNTSLQFVHLAFLVLLIRRS